MEEKQTTQASQTSQTEAQKPRVRDLFTWKSLARPAKSYSREVFTTFGAVALLVSIILLFFQEFLAIVLVWAALFLFYALTKMPPEEVEHKITTEGLVSIGHAYIWAELGPFWFSEKNGDTLLHVAHRNIFGQQVLLIDGKDKEKIRDILADYLPFIEVPEKSMVERLTDWFGKRLSLEKMTKTPPASVG